MQTSSAKINKMDKLLFASFNPHKIEEVAAILSPIAEIVSPKDIGYQFEPEENALTLEGNALIKAQSLFAFAQGLPVIADDTGLEVELLNGAPGVLSARFAGEVHNDVANRRKLLHELHALPTPWKAQFRTVIAYIAPTGEEHLFEGVVKGVIATNERGKNGFGYDSLFVPDGYNVTFAEMSETEKNKISHRKRALNCFATFLTTQ